MQVVIFCGGKGSRLKEETEFRPKPMIEIGGRPILWHIMKIYAHHGHNEFILPLGYKGNMIKDFFLNHKAMLHDFTMTASVKNDAIKFHSDTMDDFSITFADTGLETLTEERLLKIKKYIKGDDFMVTYGDGVSDIDINALVAYHKQQQTIGTITGVLPYSKYGLVKVDRKTGLASEFKQKPLLETNNQFVGGGFMVFNKKVFDYLEKGNFENIFPNLVSQKQMSVYVHKGFWMCMDTYWEMEELNRLWDSSRPWAVWEKRNLS